MAKSKKTLEQFDTSTESAVTNMVTPEAPAAEEPAVAEVLTPGQLLSINDNIEDILRHLQKLYDEQETN